MAFALEIHVQGQNILMTMLPLPCASKISLASSELLNDVLKAAC